MVNQSLSSGIFPNKLNIAKVIPIFMKDDAHLFNNYRPISLLPIISKVFEKVVQEQLTEFLNVNKLLYKSIRIWKSSLNRNSNTRTYRYITSSIRQKRNTYFHFFYLPKAFDTIDHNMLYIKLRHYGINGVPLKS